MKRNDILYILIPACILVFVWIAFNIQHSAITSTISEATNIQIMPIDSTFDMQTINAIKQREAAFPISVLKNQATISAPTPSQKATSSASETATKSAQ